jgi:asparagine synthase (glutamine-hydrolysing)
VGDRLRARLFTPEALAQAPTPAAAHILQLVDRAGDRDELDRALYIDLKSYLSDNCLVKVDRMSMAVSLESRVPLLDPELVALAFRMPPALKVRGSHTKVLLKRAAARHVPRDCVYRAKEGFSIPLKHWLAGEFRPMLDRLLDPGRLGREGVFRPDVIRCLVDEHMTGRANHSHLLWSILIFEDWRDRWAA